VAWGGGGIRFPTATQAPAASIRFVTPHPTQLIFTTQSAQNHSPAGAPDEAQLKKISKHPNHHKPQLHLHKTDKISGTAATNANECDGDGDGAPFSARHAPQSGTQPTKRTQAECTRSAEINSQLTARQTRGAEGRGARPSREKSCERRALLEPTAVEAEAKKRRGRGQKAAVIR
jgi:hypothetical protein